MARDVHTIINVKPVDIRTAIITQSDAAALLGVTASAVNKWGLPAQRGARNGIYYRLADVVSRRLKNLQERFEANSDNLTAARVRYEEARSENVELKNEVLKGTLVPTAAVSVVWNDIAARIKSKLQAIPAQYSAILADERDPAIIETLLRQAVNEPLGEIKEIDPQAYIAASGVVDRYGATTDNESGDESTDDSP